MKLWSRRSELSQSWFIQFNNPFIHFQLRWTVSLLIVYSHIRILILVLYRHHRPFGLSGIIIIIIIVMFLHGIPVKFLLCWLLCYYLFVSFYDGAISTRCPYPAFDMRSYSIFAYCTFSITVCRSFHSIPFHVHKISHLKVLQRTTTDGSCALLLNAGKPSDYKMMYCLLLSVSFVSSIETTPDPVITHSLMVV